MEIFDLCVRMMITAPLGSCHDWLFYCMIWLSFLLSPVYQVRELEFAAGRRRVGLLRGQLGLFFFLPFLSAEAEPSSHQLNWSHCGIQPLKLIWFILELSPVLTSLRPLSLTLKWWLGAINEPVMSATWTRSLQPPYIEQVYSMWHGRMLISLMFIKLDVTCVWLCSHSRRFLKYTNSNTHMGPPGSFHSQQLWITGCWETE